MGAVGTCERRAPLASMLRSESLVSAAESGSGASTPSSYFVQEVASSLSEEAADLSEVLRVNEKCPSESDSRSVQAEEVHAMQCTGLARSNIKAEGKGDVQLNGRGLGEVGTMKNGASQLVADTYVPALFTSG